MPDSVRLKRHIEKVCEGITFDLTFTADAEFETDVYVDCYPVGDWHVSSRDYFTVIEVVGLPDSGKSILSLADALGR